MKPFLDDSFLLNTKTSRTLYHEFAKEMPIIDYHNHLPPDQITKDINFQNLTQAWLYGDHYKWRAMRANGVNEAYCTGNKSDEEKFMKWAETVPYTLRNPLYHWTHLELQRYFGIKELLSPKSAKSVYDIASEQLRSPEFSTRNLLKMMNVEVVCTTDDPVDSLESHQAFKDDELKMLPAFRPDKAILISNPGFKEYILKLSEVVDFEIKDYDDLIKALKNRVDYFHKNNCRLADHGLEHIYAEDFTEEEADKALKKALQGQSLNSQEALKYQSALLYALGLMYADKGWTQQFHLGALRNNNRRAMVELGPDTGFDSMGDFSQAVALSRYLSKLDETNQLAKTILYNLNPSHNEVFATMAGNFNDGSVVGKVQFGSGWWFLDQKDGMTRQLNTLSNMGLLSRFVGMLTDSRSFLSFPRHEYFRRILCNLFGEDIENGELPNDLEWTGKIIQDICYYNAKDYFNF